MWHSINPSVATECLQRAWRSCNRVQVLQRKKAEEESRRSHEKSHCAGRCGATTKASQHCSVKPGLWIESRCSTGCQTRWSTCIPQRCCHETKKTRWADGGPLSWSSAVGKELNWSPGCSGGCGPFVLTVRSQKTGRWRPKPQQC